MCWSTRPLESAFWNLALVLSAEILHVGLAWPLLSVRRLDESCEETAGHVTALGDRGQREASETRRPSECTQQQPDHPITYTLSHHPRPHSRPLPRRPY